MPFSEGQLAHRHDRGVNDLAAARNVARSLESGWCSQPDPTGEPSMTTAAPPRRLEDTIMTTEQKIIRAKVGLLELASSSATSAKPARSWVTAGIASTGSRNSTTQAASWRCRRSAAQYGTKPIAQTNSFSISLGELLPEHAYRRLFNQLRPPRKGSAAASFDAVDRLVRGGLPPR